MHCKINQLFQFTMSGFDLETQGLNPGFLNQQHHV